MRAYEDEEGLRLLRHLAATRGVSVAGLLRLLVREEASRVGIRADRITEQGELAPLCRRISAEELRLAAESARDYYATDADALELADFIGDEPDE